MLFILNALFVSIADGQDGKDASRKSLRPKFDARVTLKDSKAADKLSKLEKKLAFIRGELENLHAELEKMREDKSGLTRELQEALDEKTVLRKELIEILEKFEEQKAKQRDLRLSLATIYVDGEEKRFSDKEIELLGSLRRLSVSAGALAGQASGFCKYMNSVLKNLKLDNLELARIKYKMDEVRESATKAATLINSDSRKSNLEHCRVLAVNDELKVVILDVGLSNGARNGLQWRIGKTAESCNYIKTVSIRPFVSAAIVTKGSLKNITPGMEAYQSARQKRKKQ